MEENKEMNEGLFKVRSYLGCLSEGIKLPTRNFIPLLKFLYPTLVVSALFTVGAFLFAWNAQEITTNKKLIVLLFQAVSLLPGCLSFGQLSVAVSHYNATSTLEGLHPWALRKEILGAFGRSALAFYALFFIFIIYNIIIGLLLYVLIPNVLLLMLLGIVLFPAVFILAVMVPYQMTACDYMLDGKQGFLKSLARMKDGYRNWGAFFIVPLCGGFLSGLVALVGSLPFFILINVKFLARQATMIGDATDLPAMFPVMLGVTGLIALLFILIGSWFVFFPTSYLYGSVEACKKERERFEAEGQEQ